MYSGEAMEIKFSGTMENSRTGLTGQGSLLSCKITLLDYFKLYLGLNNLPMQATLLPSHKTTV